MSITRKLTARVRSARIRNGIRACRDRASIDRNTPMSTGPTTIVVSVVALPHEVVAAWVRP